MAGEEFATAVKALAAGELDPYQAADRLAGRMSPRRAPVRYGSAMAETFVTVERRPDDVALIRLDRPKANALSAAVLGQLHAAAAELCEDPPGAVVLWGGRRIFAAGADIVELDESGAGAVGATSPPRSARWPRCPGPPSPPSTATPSGAGSSWRWPATSASAREDARFGLPEVLLGVIPGGGGTQRLPRLIGASRAKELIFTGRQVRAEEALSIGLVNRVVAPDYVLEAALAWAAELARGPLVAHGLAKAAVDRGLEGSLADGLAIEQEAFVTVARTEDAARGIASFAEHGPGKATFVGR